MLCYSVIVPKLFRTQYIKACRDSLKSIRFCQANTANNTSNYLVQIFRQNLRKALLLATLKSKNLVAQKSQKQQTHRHQNGLKMQKYKNSDHKEETSKKNNAKVKTPRMNWTTTDNFRVLKPESEAPLCGDKAQRTMLTDRTIPDIKIRIIVPNFSGLLNKYVRFEDITVGIVYPTQSGNCGLLSLSDFFKRYYNIEGQRKRWNDISWGNNHNWTNGTM